MTTNKTSALSGDDFSAGDLAALSFDFASVRAAYRQGVRVAALVREVHARLMRDDNEHVWTHVIALDALLERAQELERLRQDGVALPLFGIPYGVKGNIDGAGLPTTAGCAGFGYVAERTAAVVERLHRAGAILIGKQNMDQFATGLVGIRSPHGYCRNSFDRRYIPGGSSSGSAVAVSSGHVGFSIGSDTGGSGRVPAALNNIVGPKPTPGRVSTYGFLYCNRSFDVAPVFALTTDDAYDVLDVIEGQDARDPYSHAVPAESAATQVAPGFRFAIPDARHLEFFGDEQARRQFAAAVGRLVERGGTAVEVDFAPFLEAGRMVFNSPLIAERWLTYGAFCAQGSDDLDPNVRQAILAAQQYSAADAHAQQYRLQELQRQVHAGLADLAFLLVPTCGTIYRCDEVEADPVRLNTNLGYYTYFANPLRLCAISVPAGLRGDGLPFGACLLAPADADRRLQSYANALHAAFGGNLGATRHAFARPVAAAA